MASHSDTELDVMSKKGEAQISIGAVDEEAASDRTWRRKAAAVIWDSLDKSPEERKFIAKIDWWILSYCCVAYFVKYLEYAVEQNPPLRHLRHLLTGPPHEQARQT